MKRCTSGAGGAGAALLRAGPDEFGLGGWPDALELGRLHISVDAARFCDDDSVIQPRRGIRAYRPTVIHGMDTRQIAGKVVEVVREMRGMNEHPVVNVDVIGWGAGVLDALAERNDLEVHAINVAEHAVAQDEYANLRTEMWFQIRNWLRAGGAIPDDGTLEGELVAPTYDFDGSARQRVERKENIKKRLHRSPDRADALGLSIIRVLDRDETSIGSPSAAADLGGIDGCVVPNALASPAWPRWVERSGTRTTMRMTPLSSSTLSTRWAQACAMRRPKHDGQMHVAQPKVHRHRPRLGCRRCRTRTRRPRKPLAHAGTWTRARSNRATSSEGDEARRTSIGRR